MLINFVCYIIEKSNGTMVQWYFPFDLRTRIVDFYN